LTGVADSERRYEPGEVRPRDLSENPHCPDCKTGVEEALYAAAVANGLVGDHADLAGYS
jgi:hypothetical protein